MGGCGRCHILCSTFIKTDPTCSSNTRCLISSQFALLIRSRHSEERRCDEESACRRIPSVRWLSPRGVKSCCGITTWGLLQMWGEQRYRFFSKGRINLSEYENHAHTVNPKKVPKDFVRVPLHHQSAGELLESIITAGQLRLQNANFWKRCTTTVVDIASGFRVRELVAIVNAYAKANFRDEFLFKTLAKLIALQAPECRASDIAVTVQSYARVNLRCRELMTVLAREALGKLHELEPRGIAIVTWSYGRLDLYHKSLFDGICEQLIAGAAADYNSIDITQILWALAHLRLREEAAVETLCTHIRLHIKNYSIPEVLVCTHSLAKLKCIDEELQSVLRVFFTQQFRAIPFLELPKLLQSLTRLDGYSARSCKGAKSLHFCSNAKSCATSNAFTSVSSHSTAISPPLTAFPPASPKALYRLLVKSMVTRIWAFTPTDLEVARASLAAVGLTDDILNEAAAQVIPHKVQAMLIEDKIALLESLSLLGKPMKATSLTLQPLYFALFPTADQSSSKTNVRMDCSRGIVHSKYSAEKRVLTEKQIIRVLRAFARLRSFEHFFEGLRAGDGTIAVSPKGDKDLDTVSSVDILDAFPAYFSPNCVLASLRPASRLLVRRLFLELFPSRDSFASFFRALRAPQFNRQTPEGNGYALQEMLQQSTGAAVSATFNTSGGSQEPSTGDSTLSTAPSDTDLTSNGSDSETLSRTNTLSNCKVFRCSSHVLPGSNGHSPQLNHFRAGDVSSTSSCSACSPFVPFVAPCPSSVPCVASYPPSASDPQSSRHASSPSSPLPSMFPTCSSLSPSSSPCSLSSSTSPLSFPSPSSSPFCPCWPSSQQHPSSAASPSFSQKNPATSSTCTPQFCTQQEKSNCENPFAEAVVAAARVSREKKAAFSVSSETAASLRNSVFSFETTDDRKKVSAANVVEEKIIASKRKTLVNCLGQRATELSETAVFSMGETTTDRVSTAATCMNDTGKNRKHTAVGFSSPPAADGETIAVCFTDKAMGEKVDAAAARKNASDFLSETAAYRRTCALWLDGDTGADRKVAAACSSNAAGGECKGVGGGAILQGKVPPRKLLNGGVASTRSLETATRKTAGADFFRGEVEKKSVATGGEQERRADAADEEAGPLFLRDEEAATTEGAETGAAPAGKYTADAGGAGWAGTPGRTRFRSDAGSRVLLAGKALSASVFEKNRKSKFGDPTAAGKIAEVQSTASARFQSFSGTSSDSSALPASPLGTYSPLSVFPRSARRQEEVTSADGSNHFRKTDISTSNDCYVVDFDSNRSPVALKSTFACPFLEKTNTGDNQTCTVGDPYALLTHENFEDNSFLLSAEMQHPQQERATALYANATECSSAEESTASGRRAAAIAARAAGFNYVAPPLQTTYNSTSVHPFSNRSAFTPAEEKSSEITSDTIAPISPARADQEFRRRPDEGASADKAVRLGTIASNTFFNVLDNEIQRGTETVQGSSSEIFNRQSQRINSMCSKAELSLGAAHPAAASTIVATSPANAAAPPSFNAAVLSRSAEAAAPSATPAEEHRVEEELAELARAAEATAHLDTGAAIAKSGVVVHSPATSCQFSQLPLEAPATMREAAAGETQPGEPEKNVALLPHSIASATCPARSSQCEVIKERVSQQQQQQPDKDCDKIYDYFSQMPTNAAAHVLVEAIVRFSDDPHVPLWLDELFNSQKIYALEPSLFPALLLELGKFVATEIDEIPSQHLDSEGRLMETCFSKNNMSENATISLDMPTARQRFRQLIHMIFGNFSTKCETSQTAESEFRASDALANNSGDASAAGALDCERQSEEATTAIVGRRVAVLDRTQKDMIFELKNNIFRHQGERGADRRMGFAHTEARSNCTPNGKRDDTLSTRNVHIQGGDLRAELKMKKNQFPLLKQLCSSGLVVCVKALELHSPRTEARLFAFSAAEELLGRLSTTVGPGGAPAIDFSPCERERTIPSVTAKQLARMLHTLYKLKVQPPRQLLTEVARHLETLSNQDFFVIFRIFALLPRNDPKLLSLLSRGVEIQKWRIHSWRQSQELEFLCKRLGIDMREIIDETARPQRTERILERPQPSCPTIADALNDEETEDDANLGAMEVTDEKTYEDDAKSQALRSRNCQLDLLHRIECSQPLYQKVLTKLIVFGIAECSVLHSKTFKCCSHVIARTSQPLSSQKDCQRDL